MDTFRTFKTSEGSMSLSTGTYGEAAVHISPGVARWADKSDRNTTLFDKAIAQHSRKVLLGSTVRAGESSHDWPSSPDTVYITTEIRLTRKSGKSFSWMAFASEF